MSDATSSAFEVEIGFSLGSNLGDRVAHLRAAKRMLLEQPQARFLAQSSLYETEPVGVDPAYRHLTFVNAVLLIGSSWPVEGWMSRVQGIEDALERQRTADRFAPRTIDIDILYAGGTSVGGTGLVVPHPRWAGRRFVLEPLAEVRPDLILPGARGSVRSILDQLPANTEDCVRLATPW
jgi:2-amino-4-hydroxy-6-hydroxymethyldihydropteridine diphosphokinase